MCMGLATAFGAERTADHGEKCERLLILTVNRADWEQAVEYNIGSCARNSWRTGMISRIDGLLILRYMHNKWGCQCFMLSGCVAGQKEP